MKRSEEKIKILLAEDEEALGMIVKESLETRDFEVTLCKNGVEALKSFRQTSPSLVILDVMMPQVDGFSVAEGIRKENNQVPIIFLTSRSRTQDVIEGFQLGGNDYMRKPFSMEELIVRIRELLNRTVRNVANQEIKLGDYLFNSSRQTLQYQKDIISLTHREAMLLQKLGEHPNEVVTRKEILNQLWGADDFFNGRSMDVFITKLRKKLTRDPRVQIINVRGYGYKLIM